MTKEQLKERLKEELNILLLELNGSAKDFYNDNYYNDVKNYYLGDLFMDYADNNTSIYYSEQRKYYNEHAEECEEALLEQYDPQSIADYILKNGLDGLICHAGAIGEFEAIYRELRNQEEEIKKALSLFELITQIKNGNEDITADNYELVLEDLINDLK